MRLALLFIFILYSTYSTCGKDLMNDEESVINNLKNSVESTFSKLNAFPDLISSLKKQKRSPNTTSEVKSSYDYIIVGAGSAGSVLANRLSANSCSSVLLLEAGTSPPVLTEIPAIERFFQQTNIDWNFTTVPQKHCCSNQKDKKLFVPSGKVLGGSSVLNDVQYSRGNPLDYDNWARMGATGWSYKDVFPYFIKLEDNRDPKYARNGYHGVGGPQTISTPPYHAETKKYIFDAASSLGIPITDGSGPHQLGIYDIQTIERDGQLCSTAKAYLVPADNRTNLDIVDQALVTKVIIKQKKAVGVQFIFKGVKRTVTATKEVILSAGGINTPKLLMLSGIGPAEELRKHNISVIVDLPGVGRNLQDHSGSFINFKVNNTVNAGLKLIDPANLAQYVHNRTGPLSSALFALAILFLQNLKNVGKSTTPDYQLYFAEFSVLLPLLDNNMKKEAFLQIYSKYLTVPYLVCLCQIAHPRSRGTVTLTSSDPDDPPLIDPNYFEDQADVQDIVEGLKACLKIGRTDPMKSIGTEPFDSLYPGCEQHANNITAYLTCQVISTPISFYHHSGTAKMGNPQDPSVVVDPELRLKGVRNLRVVDASIMPNLIAGNTNIPVIMIAEKASDMIISGMKCRNNDSRHGY